MPAMWKLAFVLLSCVSVFAQDEEGVPGEEETEAAKGGLGALGGALSRKPERIDFTKVDRTIRKLPPLKAENPLYGLFLFGVDGKARVWAVLDKSARERKEYDVLYLDRNADGDLSGKDERFEGGDAGVFAIGDFREPGTEVVHKALTIQRAKGTFFYRIQWAGKAVLSGPHGPTTEEGADLACSPAEAPVFFPGIERPFEFEHWMSGTLKRGEENDFKVFIGQRGDRRGTFTCVDDKFLPEGEKVLVQLVCRDTAGKERKLTAELAERC
ncbi:MAG TPA: hypothetical protein VFY93_18085 [Planctomycetota bacterium]|nr:hypothetical protein [Planctomycetota bacterium]